MVTQLSRRTLRRMNFIADQTGILNRYFNEIENWNSHLANTKQYIINFIRKNKFKTVSVLGTGWLLDLPLDFFKNHSEKVYLYDIFHPAQIKHKLKNFKQFEFIVADITGGLIEEAFNAVNQFRKKEIIAEIDNLKFSGFIPVAETDCYISLNILNQLDILITDYLKSEDIYSDKKLEKLKSEIQKKHINSLPLTKSCMITDYEEIVFDMKDNFVEKKSLLYTKLPEGKNSIFWDWRFDTTGTYNNGQKTTFNVIAMEI